MMVADGQTSVAATLETPWAQFQHCEPIS